MSLESLNIFQLLNCQVWSIKRFITYSYLYHKNRNHISCYTTWAWREENKWNVTVTLDRGEKRSLWSHCWNSSLFSLWSWVTHLFTGTAWCSVTHTHTAWLPFDPAHTQCAWSLLSRQPLLLYWFVQLETVSTSPLSKLLSCFSGERNNSPVACSSFWCVVLALTFVLFVFVCLSRTLKVGSVCLTFNLSVSVCVLPPLFLFILSA